MWKSKIDFVKLYNDLYSLGLYVVSHLPHEYWVSVVISHCFTQPMAAARLYLMIYGGFLFWASDGCLELICLCFFKLNFFLVHMALTMLKRCATYYIVRICWTTDCNICTKLRICFGTAKNTEASCIVLSLQFLIITV